MMVRHLDGNYLNNSESNIDLGTNSDNMMDIPKGVRVSRSSNASKKYSDELAQAIKLDKENGMSYKELMIKYDISSKGTLSYIINHRQ